MRYHSPIRFYEYCGVTVGYPAEVNPTRIKKQVAAEFALAVDGIISIDGHDYNKNDILQDFDSPDWFSNLQFHQMIWDNKGLLRCIEEDKISMSEASSQWLKFSRDAAFVKFVSPYFAESFNNIMKLALSFPNFEDARWWFAFLVFVEPDDQEKALQSSRVFLEEALSTFKNVNASTYLNKIQIITPWSKQQWHIFINDLPDSLYYYKEDIAAALINFTFEIQNADLHLAYLISVRLSHVRGLSSELSKIIADNHAVFSNRYDRSLGNTPYQTDSGSGGKPSTLATVFRVVFIVFICVRLLLFCARM